MTERSDDPTEVWTPYGEIPDYGGPVPEGEPAYYEGQYVAGGGDWDDHDPFAAGAGLDGEGQDPHEPEHEDALPEPAPSARARSGRGTLVLGIAIGALAIGGAFIAGALLVPGLTGGTPVTTSAETAADLTGIAPPPETTAATEPETTATGTPSPSPSASPSDDDDADAPSGAVDLSGEWTGHVESTFGTRVEFIVSIDDDGTTLSGTIEYTSFECGSTVAQTARDDATVTVSETLTSGRCVSTGVPITYRYDPADPDRLIIESSSSTGEMRRD